MDLLTNVWVYNPETNQARPVHFITNEILDYWVSLRPDFIYFLWD